MANFSGIVSAIVASVTAKGKPQLAFTLTGAEATMDAIVFTEERIATFADMKDGDEVVIAGQVSNGRFAPEGTLIAKTLNPEVAPPADFFSGEDVAQGAMVVLTAGAYGRKMVVGIATAMSDITVADINEAQAEAAVLGVSWQEVMLSSGQLRSMEYTELHTTRAYADGDTKAGLYAYNSDEAVSVEHMRKVGVVGYAAAAKAAAEAAQEAEAAEAPASEEQAA